MDIIRQSRDAGSETLVKGGIARLSFGSEGPGDDDDTLWVWDDPDLLPNGAVMVSARKSTFDGHTRVVEDGVLLATRSLKPDFISLLRRRKRTRVRVYIVASS